jgi:H+/Cl- antiporter ClcA/CBS domain-containing protein
MDSLYTTAEIRTPAEYEPVNHRTVVITGLALLIAIGAGLAAQLLVSLISLVTNVAFYGRISTAFVQPAGGHNSPIAILLTPIVGAIVVGIMARYGSAAIRGHGIPEVMEKVLFGESRISGRVLILKPLSAAVAIGTGGPFGAEGPIIATGGALGSLAGQVIRITADERKTLLAAGAAAGMAATFGAPISSVLLAVELLLFEYRARSLIPVAIAAGAAEAVRMAFSGTAPVFAIPDLQQPSRTALAGYLILGLIVGLVAALIVSFTYKIEDAFEHIGERFHIHWMWFPALGAVVVGVVGLVEPRTLGVGYENIVGAMNGSIVGISLLMLVALKLLSWAVYLGSGTSGGTMAPLFTIGSGFGAWLGALAAHWTPWLGVDARVAGLVGMAAMFAGASHALLASIVFAFETTRQSVGLLPLLIGCSAAYFTALLWNRNSIMTEKLARRGVSVSSEYALDYLGRVSVADAGVRAVTTVRASDSLAKVREWLASGDPNALHQGFPVLDDAGLLVGVVTHRDLMDPSDPPVFTIGKIVRRPPVIVYSDSTLRDAADQMVVEHVGRLPVVHRGAPRKVVGILSRSDLLTAHAPRLEAARSARTIRRWPTTARSK